MSLSIIFKLDIFNNEILSKLYQVETQNINLPSNREISDNSLSFDFTRRKNINKVDISRPETTEDAKFEIDNNSKISHHKEDNCHPHTDFDDHKLNNIEEVLK